MSKLSEQLDDEEPNARRYTLFEDPVQVARLIRALKRVLAQQIWRMFTGKLAAGMQRCKRSAKR